MHEARFNFITIAAFGALLTAVGLMATYLPLLSVGLPVLVVGLFGALLTWDK